ncbi:MAG: hypothetical protein Q4C71_06160, partial [Microbacteriaceae bacterium]|nr:hypothetical protein [Microbacteriaceae bacterium]
MTEIKLKNTKVASAESAGSGKFGRLLVAALAGGALLLSGCAGENKAQPTQQSQNQHEKQQNSQQNKPSEQ